MKHVPQYFSAIAVSVLLFASSRADVVIPGANGSDGALNITTSTVIDLSQAEAGQWDNKNASGPNHTYRGRGIIKNKR